jgi:hypothetical protein
MFNFIKKIIGLDDIYPALVEEAKAKGHNFYISGGDFGMDMIFSGSTKEETVQNAYNILKAESPDILKAYSDQTKDPAEQEKLFRASLEFLIEEIK